MICDKIDIRRGDRVRLSPLGAARCPRLADKEGLIVGVGRYQSTVRIIFDGLKSPTSLHRDYVEPVPGWCNVSPGEEFPSQVGPM